MSPELILDTLAKASGKHAVLGFTSEGVRVARDSVARAAHAPYLTATLVKPYGSGQPESHIVFDPAAVEFLQF